MPMNRYGAMALEFSRQYRPTALAEIEDPERFFTAAGEQIANEIAQVRDQILGPARPDENAEQHPRQSQAWRTAEELVLADHWLLVPEPETDDEGPDTTDDPELAAYYRDLDLINETIIQLYDR
jgi:hypothetical protein